MRGHFRPSKTEPTMLSLGLRTKLEATLPKAAQPSCGHSLPGRWYQCPLVVSPCDMTTRIDSRFDNQEALP
jgi:hypothetical protein